MIKNNKRAFSLIEISIGLILSCMVLFGAYSFFTYTRQQYMYGTVNLQNLEDARMAINYLRRDFSCACPFLDYLYDKSNLLEDGSWKNNVNPYEELQKLRKNIFNFVSTSGNSIIIDKDQSMAMEFYKFVFDPGELERPQMSKVEKVHYEFDKQARTLIRSSQKGATVTFKGIEDVKFDLYLLSIKLDEDRYKENSVMDVPVLWVSMKIHEGKEKYGDTKKVQPLEISTSITSPYITSWMHNRRWRSDMGQYKIED